METTVSQDRETNIALVSEGYAAFGRGDMETVTRLFHPDMVWHALRLGELSGDKVGRSAVFAFFGRTMELTQGTFSVTPLGNPGQRHHGSCCLPLACGTGDRI